MFTSSGQILPINEVSDPITLQLQDVAGNPKATATGYTVSLSSSLGQGEFSLDAGNWNPITQVTFNSGENTKVIYYKVKSGGSHMLSASNASFNN